MCTGFLDLSHTQAHDREHRDIGAAAEWGGPSVQIVQGQIMDHLGPQGALFSSAPQGSSSQMTIDPAFSPADELYSQSKVQGYLPYVTSFPPRQVQPVQDAAQSHAVTQEQNTTAQTTSWQHEQRVQRKRMRDKERKHDTRLNDYQAYTRVCELLEIEQTPKNSLSQRSECSCVHRVGGIERFIVLKRVESSEPDYEEICKLLDISTKPRDTLPHRSKCSCTQPHRGY